MENLVFVFYVNVSATKSTEKVRQILASVKANIKQELKDDERVFVIPIHTGEPRMECINPQLLGAEKYNEVVDRITELNKATEEFLNDKR